MSAAAAEQRKCHCHAVIHFAVIFGVKRDVKVTLISAADEASLRRQFSLDFNGPFCSRQQNHSNKSYSGCKSEWPLNWRLLASAPCATVTWKYSHCQCWSHKIAHVHCLKRPSPQTPANATSGCAYSISAILAPTGISWPAYRYFFHTKKMQNVRFYVQSNSN